MKEARILCLPLAFLFFTVSLSCSNKTIRKNDLGPLRETVATEEVIANEETDIVQEQEIVETETVPEQQKRVEYCQVEKMIFPVDEKYKDCISSPQGYRESIPLPGGGSTIAGLHNAIDIACPDKTPVYAVKDGIYEEVWPSYYNGGKSYKGDGALGGKIVIAHYDGTKTEYAHLSYTMPSAIEKTEVKQGETIGWSGGVKGRRGSGSSTGPHLHFTEIIMIEDQFY